MEVKVLNQKGAETGRSVQLSADVFGIQPNDHAIYLDVKQFLANQRQGTHKTKDRTEINRSTRKVFRQKGTGGARHGSLKSGIYVGGARIHGPRPRDYSFKLNKKLKRLARLSALSYKAQNQQIVVVEDLQMSAPKTSEFATMLKALNVNGRSLFVTADMDKNVFLSGRNIMGNVVMTAGNINTYEVMKASHLILTESSIAKIQETHAK
ncbi:MAG: 50S ribosomal protein L4 [Bacteroidetes bacterium]|jgi:large subunit ribosomal protein L4|nr:50S ribosomal protein L4 [Bacteroidota bacterium]MDA0942697.1 50S ribosomal protein L4 [Bacteroidota bacterium]MDA1111351.1 50S ribosomal protein L4 [Bacteroidota bacterium]